MPASAQDSLLGREIDGYLIETLLGEGGMARVYRGRDIRLNRYVAIKVILPAARADAAYTSRFEKEARAVAQLDHPNIVKIYRFGDVDGLYYMAMQYIEGADLSWILGNYAGDNEFIPHEDALRIITEICQALDYAHSQGIIHRDVKPSNIILNKQGRAFLSDFGLALLQAEGTRGEIFGSPYYIAPEQAINSAGAVPQSDLYALGVVLYQMLTGSVPFDEGSMMDIAMAHMTDAPPAPLSLNPLLHPALVPVLDLALCKEPSARYQTGAALAGALARAIQISAQPSHATKPGSTRLSMLSVPDKVSEFRKGHPLPPLPAEGPAPQAEPTLPAAGRNASPSSAPTIDMGAAQAPMPATGVGVRPQPVPAITREALLPRASSRKTSLFLGAGVGVVACLALALLLLLLTNGSGNSEAALATETVMDVAAAATTTPLPTRTTIPTSTPIEASPTAVVLVPTTVVPPQVALVPTTAVPAPVAVVPSATPSPQPIGYDLLLVKRGEDSLFVINQTGRLWLSFGFFAVR